SSGITPAPTLGPGPRSCSAVSALWPTFHMYSTCLHSEFSGSRHTIRAMDGENGDSAGIRILVVDDEESITDLLATALRYERFEVEVAHTGRDAMRAVPAFRPDLMVLDV